MPAGHCRDRLLHHRAGTAVVGRKAMLPAHLAFRRLRHVPIEQVLLARGVRLAKRGHNLVGPCPVHGGDNPTAFVVHPAKNLWRCFTHCDGGGDVVELVRRLDRCGYREAAQTLASLAGAAPLSTPSPPPFPPHGAPFQPYTRRLHLDPHAPFLRRKGIMPDTARRFEVGAYNGRGFLDGCVGVRLHDKDGLPLGYAGRRLDPEQAQRLGKWKLPPRLPKSHLLYNLHRARPTLSALPLVIVECPWGTMRLAQLRLRAVALLGTTLSEPQVGFLAHARRLVLLLDGDHAGRHASARIQARLGTHKTAVAHLPDGLDPDDLSDPDLASLLHPLFPF